MDYNALSKLCLELGGESPNAIISDEHLAIVASELTELEPLAPHLGIIEAEEKEIRHDSSSYKDQKTNALRKWRQSHGMRATYKELSRILSNVPVEPSVLVSLESHLKKCYQKARSPTVLQWPKLKHSTYVEPVMYEVPVEEESQSTPGIMPATTCSEKTVELEAIFSAEQGGEVVLLEGVAGAGKTMLTWHASRMWAEGSLFPDTQLLIHISLRNKYFHSASCLTDLIPHPSKRLRKDIASTMVEKNGRGVCFIFDGWDELPPEVQDNSFLLDFITRQGPHAALPECSILVTSRPHASASLTPARKIEIQGFNKKQLRKYLSDSTEGSEKATDKLMKAVSKNPQLTLLCLIPLMAAILVFLFSFTDDTESRYVLSLKTHTEMFKVLVINLLLRHMQLRVRHRQKKLREISNLPPDLQEKFKIVCRVAFYGVVNDKAVFDFDDLQSLGISSEIDTLGLMQANEQLTWFGPTKDYSFLHHHIQTFLAGYHISQLPHEEHAGTVRKVLQKHPLSSALTVYGGLSRLNNKKALDVLLEVSKMPLDYHSVTMSMAQSRDVGSDRRRLLLALLRCIYEAQSQKLYLQIKPPNNPILIRLSRSDDDWVEFSFGGLSLTSTDCHVIVHFVSAIAPYREVNINLSFCSIKDEEVQAIMLMLRCTIKATKGVGLHLHDNHITHRGVYSIAKTLATTSVINVLMLDWNWHPESTDIRLALKYLIEGLSRNSSCTILDIGCNSLTEEHVHYLVLLFTFCVNLDELISLHLNKLGNSISLIAAAMNKSSVTYLCLMDCAITNHQLLQLGKALQANTSLLRLDLTHNSFTPAGFADFLRCLMPQPPALGPPLKVITVTCLITDEHNQLVEEINRRRLFRVRALSLHHGTIIRANRLEVKHPHDTVEWRMGDAIGSAFAYAQEQSPEFVSGQSSMEHLYTS